MAPWTDTPAADGAALVAAAVRLRWSAPELAVQFAARALLHCTDPHPTSTPAPGSGSQPHPAAHAHGGGSQSHSGAHVHGGGSQSHSGAHVHGGGSQSHSAAHAHGGGSQSHSAAHAHGGGSQSHSAAHAHGSGSQSYSAAHAHGGGSQPHSGDHADSTGSQPHPPATSPEGGDPQPHPIAVEPSSGRRAQPDPALPHLGGLDPLLPPSPRAGAAGPAQVHVAGHPGVSPSGAPDPSITAATVSRAQSLLAVGLTALGRPAEAVDPGVAALRSAVGAGRVDEAMTLRTALAACARALGDPLAGSEILRPAVTGAGAADLVPLVAARALAELAACLSHLASRDDVEDALTEADRLLAADEALPPAHRRLERAQVCAHTAAYHRRHGDTESAAEAAHEGLALLRQPDGAELDLSAVQAALVYELTLALLDDGAPDDATAACAPLLARPVRATFAAQACRIRLAVATRVHLPSGRTDSGRTLILDTIDTAQRHGLDTLLADAWTFLAHSEETAARPTEALHALRSARAAEHRHHRAAARARRTLSTEFTPDRDPDRAAALLRAVVRPRTPAVPLPTQSRRPVPLDGTPSGPPPPAADAGSPPSRATVPPQAAAGSRTTPEAPPVRDGRTPDTPNNPTAPTQPQTDAPSGRRHRAPDAHPLPGALFQPGAPAPTGGTGRRRRPEGPGEESSPVGRHEAPDRHADASADTPDLREADPGFTLILVRVEPIGHPDAIDPEEPALPVGDDALINALASRVRDLAPTGTDLVRSDRSEFAVLLPRTPTAIAEQFAAIIRKQATRGTGLTDVGGRPMTVRTAVANHAAAGIPRGLDSLLHVARALLRGEPAPTAAPPAEPPPAPAEPPTPAAETSAEPHPTPAGSPPVPALPTSAEPQPTSAGSPPAPPVPTPADPHAGAAGLPSLPTPADPHAGAAGLPSLSTPADAQAGLPSFPALPTPADSQTGSAGLPSFPALPTPADPQASSAGLQARPARPTPSDPAGLPSFPALPTPADPQASSAGLPSFPVLSTPTDPHTDSTGLPSFPALPTPADPKAGVAGLSSLPSQADPHATPTRSQSLPVRPASAEPRAASAGLPSRTAPPTPADPHATPAGLSSIPAPSTSAEPRTTSADPAPTAPSEAAPTPRLSRRERRAAENAPSDANDVLSRFGITAAGGGRRRAPDDDLDPFLTVGAARTRDDSPQPDDVPVPADPPAHEVPRVPEPAEIPVPSPAPDEVPPREPAPHEVPPIEPGPDQPPVDPDPGGVPPQPDEPTPGQPSAAALLDRLSKLVLDESTQDTPGTPEPEPVRRADSAVLPRPTPAMAEWLRRAGRPLPDDDVPGDAPAVAALPDTTNDTTTNDTTTNDTTTNDTTTNDTTPAETAPDDTSAAPATAPALPAATSAQPDTSAVPPSAPAAPDTTPAPQDDEPRKPGSRRERSSSALAELLAEALAAFQATQPPGWTDNPDDTPKDAPPSPLDAALSARRPIADPVRASEGGRRRAADDGPGFDLAGLGWRDVQGDAAPGRRAARRAREEAGPRDWVSDARAADPADSPPPARGWTWEPGGRHRSSGWAPADVDGV